MDDSAFIRAAQQAQDGRGYGSAINSAAIPDPVQAPQLYGISIQVMANGYLIQPQYDQIGATPRAHIAVSTDDAVGLVREMIEMATRTP